MMPAMAAMPPGRPRGDVVAGAGFAAVNAAMEALPERRCYQGVQRCAKGPGSFGMAVMAARPPGGAGATL